MNSIGYVLAIVLVVCAVVPRSEGIDCWVGSCSGCKIYQWKQSAVTKMTGCTQCSSHYSRIKVLFVEVESTVWGCEATCSPISSNVIGISEVKRDCCTGNLCNGAAGVTAGVLLLTGAAWLTTLLH